MGNTQDHLSPLLVLLKLSRGHGLNIKGSRCRQQGKEDKEALHVGDDVVICEIQRILTVYVKGWVFIPAFHTYLWHKP